MVAASIVLARAVHVVGPGHDVDLPTVGDEVGMAEPQSLANAHAGLGQEQDQEPIPKMVTGFDDCEHLLGAERARQPAGLA